jgi:capsular polysaccharide biosynthesis protein/MinD-like ATPase involved in chromosome partitioning or flagellar assembly
VTTQQLLKVGLRWSWLMVLGAVTAALVSYQFTSQHPRLYEAQTKVLIGSADPTSVNRDYVGPQTANQLATTYARVITTRPVLEAAISAASLDLSYSEAVSMVTAAPIGNTQLVQITVDAPDPELAATLANEVVSAFLLQMEAAQTRRYAAVESALAQQVDQRAAVQADLSRQVEDLRNEPPTPNQNAELARLQFTLAQAQQTYADTQRSYQEVLLAKARSANPITVVEPATPPSQPLQSQEKQSALIAAAVGLLLAGLIAYMVDRWDDRLLSVDRAERLTGLRVLGSIPRHQSEAIPEENSPATNAFQVLSASVMLALKDRQRGTLLVSGVRPGCGATTAALNVAICLAKAGRRVIVVDAHFANPSLDNLFDIKNQIGLGRLLTEAQLPVATHLVEVETPGVYLLPADPTFGTSGDLLASKWERTQLCLEELRDVADVLIVDAPLAPNFGGALAVASWVEGVVLVVDAQHTRAHEVVAVAKLLNSAGANLLGVALNRPRRRRASPTYATERAEAETSSGDEPPDPGQDSVVRPASEPSIRL